MLHGATGSTALFAAQPDGSFIAPERVKAHLGRGADNSYELTYPDQTKDVFDSDGRLLRQLDRNAYATTVSYDADGRVDHVTDEAGRRLTYAYNTGGGIASITDPKARQVQYAYDAAGDLTTVTDVGGQTVHYDYDGKHRIVSMTDARGHETTNTYDSSDRVLEQTDPAGAVTRFAYAADSTTVADQRGNQTRYERAGGHISRVVRGVGTAQEAAVAMVRNASGNVTQRTDPNGQVTKIEYDAAGNPTKITDPLDRVTTMTYSASNNILTATDSDATTTIEYDTRGNVTSVSRPLTGTSLVSTTTSEYDPAHPGDLVATTTPDGKVWHYSYDTYGNLVSSTDPAGNRATTAYNEIGWATSTVSPRGNASGANPAQYTTTYSYDDYGNLVRTDDPLGRATQFAYDAAGNPTSTTGPDGAITRTAYDDVNRPVTVTREDDSVLMFGYDANGNRTSVKDGLDHETTFAYDPLDRVNRQVDALNRATTYGYDASGRQTSMQDAAGRTTTFSYDAASQPIGIDYSQAQTADVSYSYDGLGRRVQMTDGSGTSTWTYDSLGRLKSAKDGDNRTLSYAYDLAGRPTKITYPQSLVDQTAPGQTITDPSVTRSYDDAGRLDEVSDWFGSTTGFSYDADGNLIGQSYPNQTSAAMAYDRAGQLTQRTDTGPGGTILELPYTRTLTGQLRTQNDTATQPDSTATLDYDARHQLESSTVAGQATATYGHDLADRLTQIDTPASGMRLEYDAANQLLRTVNPAGNDVLSTFDYDDLGNRTLIQPADTASGTPAPTSYAYDQANLLTAVSKAADASGPAIDRGYGYNGDGLRADLLWDHTGGIPLVLADQSALYVTGPDGLPLQRLSLHGTRRFYHHDQLGSTRATTTTTGAVAAHYDYDPYGNPTGQPTEAARFGYAGQYTDPTTGLIYMRARWYDPQTGQFITSDPIGHASGETNLYRYAAGDPANLVDPTGTSIWSTVSEAAAGALSTAFFNAPAKLFGFDPECVGGAFDFGSTYVSLAVPFPGGKLAAAQRLAAKGATKMSADQRALKELVDEATNRGRKPLAREDADTVLDWAHETGYPGARAKAGDVSNPSNWSANPTPHIHLPGAGRGGHVPVEVGVRSR